MVSVSWVNGGCSGEVFMVECSQRVAGSQPIHRFVVASKVHDYFDDLRLLQFHGVTMPSRITAGQFRKLMTITNTQHLQGSDITQPLRQSNHILAILNIQVL
ncbi:hypothetical protein DEO72_LG8g2330 [Vigna unguiculata]|uniref:Uncharacterized protein n=1 Tax=Vigna unguiculata TaxID=3917 RepID=A0A4D6MU63_VIGUN|nr:hypothetical protein DEO72_LG8g2330 [Vigna unguiculata]